MRSVAPLKHEKTKKIGHSYDPTCKSYECPKPKQLPPIVVKPQVSYVHLEANNDILQLCKLQQM